MTLYVNSGLCLDPPMSSNPDKASHYKIDVNLLLLTQELWKLWHITSRPTSEYPQNLTLTPSRILFMAPDKDPAIHQQSGASYVPPCLMPYRHKLLEHDSHLTTKHPPSIYI